MKKKLVKKLALSKETLKNLESDKLQDIQGGACVTSPFASCATVRSECC